MTKKKVLIVEDQAPIAEAEKLILQDDYEVHIARDGEEGLEKAKLLQPDLLVLDVMMPKLDGFEVCKRIRADEGLKATKIVMVTSKNRDLDEFKGMETGADDYLMKPFEPVELLHILKQVLGQ